MKEELLFPQNKNLHLYCKSIISSSRISVESLAEFKGTIPEYAGQLIRENTKVLQPSHQTIIEKHLCVIQKRFTKSSISLSDQKVESKVKTYQSSLYDQVSNTQDNSASMGQLEYFLEQLYEEIPDKVKSTRSILQLTRNTSNIPELASNGIHDFHSRLFNVCPGSSFNRRWKEINGLDNSYYGSNRLHN